MITAEGVRRGSELTIDTKLTIFYGIRSLRQPAPYSNIIAVEIVEDLEAALTQFAEIANDLKKYEYGRRMESSLVKQE